MNAIQLPRFQVTANGLVGETPYECSTVEKAERAAYILCRRRGVTSVVIHDRVLQTKVLRYGGILR